VCFFVKLDGAKLTTWRRAHPLLSFFRHDLPVISRESGFFDFMENENSYFCFIKSQQMGLAVTGRKYGGVTRNHSFR